MKKWNRWMLFANFAVFFFLNDTASGQAQSSFKDRWFGENSPWNVIIGNAPVTPYSETAVQAFAERGHINMNQWNMFTPPVIYGNSAKDKIQDIVFDDGLGHLWTLRDVPIPQKLVDFIKYRMNSGDTDGMTCLYDENRKGFYSFWQPTTDGETVAVRFGGFSPIDGPGWSATATHSPVQPHIDTPSLGRAVGANYCGGLIRASEIKAGHINHAIAIMWPRRLVRGWKTETPLVFPATSTDGIGEDPSHAVPAGARIQLDPSLTDKQLKKLGLNKVDLIVAHALQKYGGYIVDTGPDDEYVAAICFENMMTSPTKDSFGATSAWPTALSPYFRFVAPPPEIQLDTAASVGTPVP